jgi:hypothetical protein
MEKIALYTSRSGRHDLMGCCSFKPGKRLSPMETVFHA